MNKMNITFVTGNKAKFEWAKRRLRRFGITLQHKTLDVPEPREFDVEKIVQKKIEIASKSIKAPFIMEDTSFQVKALNDFPGSYIKLGVEKIGVGRICSLVRQEKNKSVCFKSALGFKDKENKVSIFICESFGIIPDEPKGDNLHGFNDLMKIFIPNGFKKTFAEMSDSEFEEYERDIEKRDAFVKLAESLKSK
jgi:non-canonical purine NTP pyrophosphatase (RdgB/HAM1 family)